MILLINENKQLERIIEEDNFSQMGVWEVAHMEKWIADNPEILGEPLFTITTEYAGFVKTNRRLDIMAMDNNGKLVVIELKRDVADSFVDLQAIHYAAYCSTLTFHDVVEIAADYYKQPIQEIESNIRNFIENEGFKDLDNQPRIILVANDFKEDTLPAVLWLRDFSVDITCVKLEAHQLGKKIIITPDVIIPLPEAKQFMEYREIKTNIISKKPSKRQEQYRIFWSKMLEKLNESKPHMNINISTSHFLKIPSGYPSIHFEWFFRGKPVKEFLVGLHFESNDCKKNLKLLKHFEDNKKEFENIFHNKEIIFEKNFFNKGTQIAIKRDNGNIDDENMEWGFKTMMKFYDTLKPILDNYFNEN